MGRAESAYTLLVRCSDFANPILKPRKPLVFFIEGLFRVAIKKHKRFSNMGAVAKLLSAACFSLALRAITTEFSPPPLICSRKIKKSVFCFSCACGICVPFSLHYIPGTAFVPHTDSRYYIPLSLQTYTSAPHSFREILISISQATCIPFSHKPSPCISNGIFYFLRRVYPITINRLKAERKVITPNR
jgi:hypothetical protein